jgi:hypothetical protein
MTLARGSHQPGLYCGVVRAPSGRPGSVAARGHRLPALPGRPESAEPLRSSSRGTPPPQQAGVTYGLSHARFPRRPVRTGRSTGAARRPGGEFRGQYLGRARRGAGLRHPRRPAGAGPPRRELRGARRPQGAADRRFRGRRSHPGGGRFPGGTGGLLGADGGAPPLPVPLRPAVLRRRLGGAGARGGAVVRARADAPRRPRGGRPQRRPRRPVRPRLHLRPAADRARPANARSAAADRAQRRPAGADHDRAADERRRWRRGLWRLGGGSGGAPAVYRRHRGPCESLPPGGEGDRDDAFAVGHRRPHRRHRGAQVRGVPLRGRPRHAAHRQRRAGSAERHRAQRPRVRGDLGPVGQQRRRLRQRPHAEPDAGHARAGSAAPTRSSTRSTSVASAGRATSARAPTAASRC